MACRGSVGGAGDWLVDYGDGSLGIVSEAIFASTYDDHRLIGSQRMALHQVIQRLLLIGARYQIACRRPPSRRPRRRCCR